MSNWTIADGCQFRTLGILKLRLADSERQYSHSPYLRFKCSVHLRDGVNIGRVAAASTLVTLDVRAKTDFLARLEAEHQAEKWLAANLDALCEERL